MASPAYRRHHGWTRVFNIFPNIEASLDLGMLFVIGLLTSVHCIAMCGGINLTQSTMAVKEGAGIVRSNLAYNIGRVISYTVIGGIVGGIGSVVSFSGVLKGTVTVAVGVIMIIMALSMLLFSLGTVPLMLGLGVFSGKLNGCNGEIIVPAFDLAIKLHEGENKVSFTPNDV